MPHSKAAAHPKLGGAVDSLEGQEPLQRDEEKLEHGEQNGCGGGHRSWGQGMPVLRGAAELSELSGWEKKRLRGHCSWHLPKEGLWRARC